MDRGTKNINNEKRDLGIYIHIPFCVKKCAYCDFLSAPATEEMKQAYINALLTEIRSYAGNTADYIVPTIFFGGGTPSCIDAEAVKSIMEAIEEVFTVDKKRFEATIEINPGTITKEKLEVYKTAGINRISFGLQSADNSELMLLGRIHTFEQFLDNYRLARTLGFDNINIDLMSALPHQTLSSWENTLEQVLVLKPEHISAYSLIIEEGTEFYDRYRPGTKGATELPDEDTDRLMYQRTKEILELNGYHRYEISNYAKKGYECRHNSSYWIGTDYLGVGLGASSLLNGARFCNLHTLKQYIQKCEAYEKCQFWNKNQGNSDDSKVCSMADLIGIRENQEQLTEQQKMEEFMFLGLRMCDGISKNAFFQRFGVTIETIYKDELTQLMRKQLIRQKGDMLQLTDYGIDISNSVLSVFLLN